MSMSTKELRTLMLLQGRCSYNEVNKAEFKRLGMKLAREVRKELGLRETADVRYNAGGIAVSGDVTLHIGNWDIPEQGAIACNGIYLQFNADGFSSGLGIMYRHCSGPKDYGAGTSTPNHWYSWQYLAEFGVIGLVRTLQSFAKVQCIANNMHCVAHCVAHEVIA